MKAQTDNLNQGKQRSQKDLAILYKRFSFNGDDLVMHLIDGSYSQSDVGRGKKLDLLKREINDAEKSFKDLIVLMNMGSSSGIGLMSSMNPVQNNEFSRNAFSYQFDPNKPQTGSQTIKQDNSSSQTFYPSLLAGFGVGAAGTVGALGTQTISTAASSSYPSFNTTQLNQSVVQNPLSRSQTFSSQQLMNHGSAGTNSFQNPSIYNNAGNPLSMSQQFPPQSNFMQQNPGQQLSQSHNFQPGQMNQVQSLYAGGAPVGQYNQNLRQQQQPIQQQPYGYGNQQYPGQFNQQPQPQFNQQNYNQQQQLQQQQQQQQQQLQTPISLPPNNQVQVQPQVQQNVVIQSNSQPLPSQLQSGQITLRNQNPKGQLRTMYCPLEIVEAFIQIANINTAKKLETCAILAGSEMNDALIIDTLIIPSQEGHVDHCYMTDEIQLFEAQIEHKVMTLGWIHTHPQYSLFLSSVDLHNQMGYQMQMPEAVAIVYSPIESARYKTFRVKDSRVNEIQKCKLSGFHEHKDPTGLPAYEECKHIVYIRASENNVKVKTLDLRHQH
eukprot:403338424